MSCQVRGSRARPSFSLEATGVLMSDIRMIMGLIKVGQNPVSRMSPQSSLSNK